MGKLSASYGQSVGLLQHSMYEWLKMWSREHTGDYRYDELAVDGSLGRAHWDPSLISEATEIVHRVLGDS